MNFIFKHIRYIFITGVLAFFLISNNGCQTIDDLQSDYLLQRSTIDSLTTRVSVLTEQLVEQNAVTSSLIEAVSQLDQEVSENEQAVSENSELLQGAISDMNSLSDAVNDIEDNLESVSAYIGDLIEESGDLSGDLFNLLNQINQIDQIIVDLGSTVTNLGSTVTNIEGNLHDHADIDDLADLITGLQTAQNDIDAIELALSITDDADDAEDAEDADDADDVVADTEAPTITLTSPTINLTVGDNFTITDPGASASDNVDGNITSSITTSGTVDTSIAGTYTIAYTVSDAAGNTNTINGTIIVNAAEDNVDPDICSDCPQKISGKDIFISGTSETEGAVYWVNGQKNPINVNSFASDITVNNGKVFVSGYAYGSGAQYWEIDGQNIIQNDLPGFEGEAQSILVKNNSVYLGGYYSHADGISGAYGCYWKDGVNYKNAGGGDHAVFGIDVNDAGAVFTAGYYLDGHHNVKAGYWKNNVKGGLSLGGGGRDGEAVSIILKPNGTQVYGGLISVPHNFLGYITKPAYWVGSQMKLCNIGSVNQGWQNSGVHGLALDGNAVYQAGWTMNMEGQYPTYWKNQTKHLLPGATVNGTQYRQGKATDIAIVDGKVVVVGMLTGAPLLNGDGTPVDYGYGPEVNNDTGYPCIWIDGTIHILDTQGDFEVGGFYIR